MTVIFYLYCQNIKYLITEMKKRAYTRVQLFDI